MTVPWEDALDECEARLDAAAAALETGAPAAAVTPFSAPAVDGPIPAHLAVRAEECSARGEELRERLERELEDIRAELRRLPRMPRTQREAHFDAQA
jgi:hypothetical protein